MSSWDEKIKMIQSGINPTYTKPNYEAIVRQILVRMRGSRDTVESWNENIRQNGVRVEEKIIN